MVDQTAKGQLLERPVIVPHEGSCLDGIFLRGVDPPPLLVASPHPLLGGSMQHPVVNEIAYGAARVGRASLRFDYRGVGASEGEVSGDPERATGDTRAALEHLIETTGCESVAIAGYSFGCWPALLLAAREPRIDRVLLVAPPRASLALPDYASVSVPIVVVVGSEDALADPARERALAEAVHPRVRVETIREADHTFRSGLVELCRITERFLGAGARGSSSRAKGPPSA
ncbi:alpha/beta hydrolase [bacterium]|nr:alpha/beta hydrolase [bacterium]